MTIVVGARVPGCTLKDLRTRLQGRLSDLSDSNADYFVNDAHREFHEMFDWPWLNVEASGAAPLTLTDFGRVEYVVDDATKDELSWIDKNRLVKEVSTDLTVTGTPSYWYRLGVDAIGVYPASTTTLNVSYWQEVADLVAGTDETLNPARYCPIVLDLAYAKAMGDKQDENDIAGKLQERVERRIVRVAAKVMVPSSEADAVLRTDWAG